MRHETKQNKTKIGGVLMFFFFFRFHSRIISHFACWCYFL